MEGAGSVGLKGTIGEFSLNEDVEYRFEGQVIEGNDPNQIRRSFDRFVFTIELTTTEGNPVAKLRIGRFGEQDE